MKRDVVIHLKYYKKTRLNLLMPMLEFTFIYLCCGACAGFLAGLFGLGGGIIIIPALLFIFNWQHIPPDYAMHLAIGTSIAIVLITSSASLLAHARNHTIHIPIFKKVFFGIVIGTSLGMMLANVINGIYLQMFYAIFLLGIACKMAFDKKLAANNHCVADTDIRLPTNKKLFVSSTLLYTLSGMLGLGGGLLMVPYLSYCGMPTRRAIATSTLCIIPAALIGTLGFIFGGAKNIPYTQFHSGFIYWPAFLGITLSSIVTVRWGVRATLIWSADRLRKAFAMFIVVVAFCILAHSIILLTH